MLLTKISTYDQGIRMRLECFGYAYLNTKDYWYVFDGDRYLHLLSVQYEAILWSRLEELDDVQTEDQVRQSAAHLGIRLDEISLDMLDIIRLYRFTMPSLALNRVRRGGFSCNIRSKS